MKLTKKEEKDIWQVYNTWLDSYLNGDVETYDSFLDNEYHFIGSTNNEEFLNRKDTTAFFKATGEQFAGMTDLRKETKTLEIFGEHVFITHFFDAWFKNQEDWSFYGRFRFSSVMHKNKEGWRFIYQHFSMPDSKSEEGQTIGFDKVHLENQELREAIQRRTIELEQKNRELEIESSLERVRAIAMGMQKSEDLMSICKIVFDELQTLGFTELRNTLIHVFVDEESYFTNYDYSFATGGNINKIPFRGNPTMEKFIKVIRKSDDAFSQLTIKGKELKDWKAFRRTNKEYEDKRLDDAKSLHYYNYSVGSSGIGISTYSQISKEKQDLLQRFRNVFQLSYKRYKDISRAEAQARETQIELALEKVRSRSMAMQHSNELQRIIESVYERLVELDIEIHACTIITASNNPNELLCWFASSDDKYSKPFLMPNKSMPIIKDNLNGFKNKRETFSKTYSFKEKNKFFNYIFEHTDFKNIPKERQILALESKVYNVSNTFMGYSGIQLNRYSDKQFSKQENKILVRFGKVFEQSYIRFLDLQKAEEQAREAQIETALEKVRSRSLAMHKSTDLSAVIENLFYQLKELDLNVISSWVSLVDVKKNSIEIWVSHGETKITPVDVKGAEFENFQQEIEAWKNKQEFILIKMPKEVAQKTLKKFFDINLSLPKEDSQFHLHQLWHEHGFLGLGMWKEASKEEYKILQRFTKVFQQTYTRFLDLQKAESQAREAQIEAALERTRTQSMLMQHSDELNTTTQVFHEQLQFLGIDSEFSYLWLPDEDEKNHLFWATWSEINKRKIIYKNKTVTFPLDKKEPSIEACYLAWESGDTVHVNPVQPNQVEDYFNTWSELLNDVDKFKPELFQDGLYYIDAYMDYGCFGIMIKRELEDEEKNILSRFSKEFQRTYTRFLDLQKAEAQAKEAKIETALEKVRSRSLAMQNSDELKELIGTVYKELNNLDMALDRCLIWIMNDDDYSTRLWMANREAEPVSFYIQNHKNPPYKAVLKGWKERDTNWEYHLKGKVKKEWDNFVFTKTEMKQFPETLKKMMQKSEQSVMSGSFHSFGCLQTAGHSSLSEEQSSILTRFAKVFNQAYTRFSDLKKAEAQAREAQIETALEKVRSRTMAMQKGEELQDVVVLLYKELITLGITNFVSCGYVEVNEKINRQLTWVTSPGGDSLGLFHLPLTGDAYFDKRYEAWKKQQTVFHQTVAGKKRRKHLEYAITTFNSKEAEEMVLNQFPDPTVFYCFNFSHGYLHLVCGSELNKEEESLLARFTKIFEQTYARFLDLQKAEKQARESEIELALERVRARSMAMQNSEELKEVIKIVYQQLTHLKINLDHSGFVVDYTPKGDWNFWIADKQVIPSKITHPYFESVWGNQFNKAKEKGEDFFATNLNFEEKNKFYKELFTFVPELPKASKDFYLNAPSLTASTVLLDNVGLYIENFKGITYTKEENNILMRFGKVFQQSYTRFLDLQKAEAQAREAQIEASLERVRSQAMAMQTSDDLVNSTSILFEELEKLKLNIQRSGIGIFNPITKDCNLWTTVVTKKGKKELVTGITSLTIHPMLIGTFDAWKKQEPYPYILKGKELEDYYRLVEKSDFHLSKKAIGKSTSLPKEYYLYTPFGAGGLYLFSDVEPSESDKQIIKRFAEVFHLTYTRYEDLQKAEARAREAQIEMALEKVRSRTMAMQKSDELPEAANNLFLQVQGLGIPAWSAGYCIWEGDKKKSSWCNMSSEGEIQKGFSLPTIGEGYNFSNPIKKGETFHVAELGGKKLVKHYNFMKTLPGIGDVLKEFDEKGIVLPTFQIFHIVYFSHGYLMFITYEPVPNDWEIFKRFGKVFQQTYTRFLDLQNAEAQTREAQIEAAMERIRSRSLAMHTSEELMDVISELRRQIDSLGQLDLEASVIHLYTEGATMFESIAAVRPPGESGEIVLANVFFPVKSIDFIEHMLEMYVSDVSEYTIEVNKEKAEEWQKVMMKHAPEIASRRIGFVKNRRTSDHSEYWNFSDFSGGALLLVTHSPASEDTKEVLRKAAQVFGLAYRRFKDLLKAEAQAREAQINLAVERVRAKALAMHKSEEIMEVVAKLKDEVMGLDIPDVVAATIFLKEGDDKVRMWDLSSLEKDNDGYEIPFDISFKLKKIDPHLYVKRIWENPGNYFVEIQVEKDFKRIISFLIENNKVQIANEVEEFTEVTKLKQLYHAVKKLNNGKLVIDLLNEPTAEMETILTKMGAAFDLAYKRFEDLQKAEAQAKEARIEAALEKVRSRSLAMHNAEELQEVVAVVAEKLNELGVIFDAGGVILCTYFPDNKDVVHWIAVDDFSTSGRYFVPYFDNPIFNDAWDSKNRGDAYFSKEFPVKAKNDFFKQAFEHSDYRQMSDDYKQFVLQAGSHNLSAAWSKNSAIIIPSLTGAIPSESDADILKRFAKVFEQAYIRFMDLQKAEAQARESQIEAALERVRSRSMAMHKSEELLDVISVVSEQLIALEFRFHHVSFANNNIDETYSFWTSAKGKSQPMRFVVPYIDIVMFRNIIAAQKKSSSFFTDILTQKEHRVWHKHLLKNDEQANVFSKEENEYIMSKGMARSIAINPNIMLIVANYASIPYTNEENKIIKRFGQVFEQSYTRFLDLQKAEAQARESLIETSLERVRSRTLAMQNSEELAQTSVVVFQQLLELGIAPNRLFIGIVKDEGASIEAWATNEDGSKLGSHFTLQASKNKSIKKMLTGWKQKKKSLVIDLKGKELQDYFQYLNKEMDIPFIHGLDQKRRVQTIAYFSGGLIGMAAPEEQPKETIKLLERFAAVFNLTYTRFNDLKVSEAQTKKAEEDLINLQAAKKSAEDALSELQLTQTQLIQSEKMASLGELTAGIAHEIQNPLNFVNNFSEVSQELLEEIRDELENGNLEEVKEIMQDVIQNLEKINHHGKRADGIVKGMLQHSRSSSGTKEPTNINALADEYLRLAYHGLRAKDKSFNATLVTDFDESIGNINILPQDLGRVVLNLLTNAFYACTERSRSVVNEKKLSNQNGYEPTVSLTTKKNANNVIISVKDNGNGIPKKVLEKIFQPFFTTKPTGQGTGLGLSMSYDIVTKGHGGELKVETKQGKGTEFKIILPV